VSSYHIGKKNKTAYVLPFSKVLQRKGKRGWLASHKKKACPFRALEEDPKLNDIAPLKEMSVLGGTSEALKAKERRRGWVTQRRARAKKKKT